MNELPCMNCKGPVAPGTARLFAGVYCCPTCFEVAERLERRGTEELRLLLTLQREAIRIALVEGRLTLATAEPKKELSKKEVLQEVVRLVERANKEKEES